MDRHRQPASTASRTSDHSTLSTPSHHIKKKLPSSSSHPHHIPQLTSAHSTNSSAAPTSATSSRLSKQSSISSSRRSKKKRKEDLARIVDSLGRDVTPLPLTGVYAKEQLDTAAAIAADAVGSGSGGSGGGDGGGGGGGGDGMGLGSMAALQGLQWTADEDVYGLAALAPSAASGVVSGLSLTSISSEQPAFSSITLTETPTTTLFTLPSLRFSTITRPTPSSLPTTHYTHTT